MANEWIFYSFSLAYNMEESVLCHMSHSVTAVPCGSLYNTGGIENFIVV